MSQSPYSFIAFIDESGDEGFKIVPPPARQSSEWFLLSAVVFRVKDWGHQSRIISQTIQSLETNGRKIHFSELRHEQRLPVIDAIAKSTAVVTTMCVHKGALLDGKQHGLDSERRLYFYTTRFLLERLSWYARDNRIGGQGNGKVALVFAHAKSLSYEKMSHYLRLLRDGDSVFKNTEIAWDHVEIDTFKVEHPSGNIGLRLADSVVSGTRMGLELSPHGFCEDRYARLLKPRVYCRKGKYLSYGLKFFPRIPAIEPQRDSRYAWIGQLFAGGN